MKSSNNIKTIESLKTSIKNPQNNKHFYNTKLCDDSMTFDECELAILRHAVDETDELQKQKQKKLKF